MHHDRFKRLVATALSRGAVRKSAMRIEWDIAGRCMAPVPRELHVRPGADDTDELVRFRKEVERLFPGAEVIRKPVDRQRTRDKYLVVKTGSAIPLNLLMWLPCRKCDRCRRKRSAMWSLRAKAETQAAVRTWFGTLTLRPDAHMTMLSRARSALARQGVNFDSLPYGEQFTERHKQCAIEITKYLKRVRKESGAKFRYLLVCEHHKSGLPHYHALIHEREGAVKHATLSKQWPLGFEKWRLLTDLREATYLCKYLSKATVARVRASGAYGTASDIDAKGVVKNDHKTSPEDFGNQEERGDGISRSVSA